MSTFSNGVWDAMATSKESVTSRDCRRRGFSCRVARPNSSNPIFMIGLASASRLVESPCFHQINFAAFVDCGHFCVYESGSSIGHNFEQANVGDIIKVILNSETPHPKIEYLVNDQIRYTSQQLPSEFPFFIKLSAHQHGPVVEDVQWITADDTDEPHSNPPSSPSSGAAKSHQINRESKMQILESMLFDAMEKNVKLELEMAQLRKQLGRRARR